MAPTQIHQKLVNILGKPAVLYGMVKYGGASTIDTIQENVKSLWSCSSG